jgi:NAD+ synthetase
MEEAKDLAQRLNIELRQISIESSFKALTASLSSELSGLTLENLQSRIRGVLLMSLANNERRLLLATSNKAELACGYSTLYGDMCGALMPIGDLYKTEVYELAHHIAHRDLELGRRERIPLRTRQRAPTAELKPNQRDSDSLPDYAWLDLFVRHYIEGAGRMVGDLDFWNRVFMPTHSVDSLCRTIEGAEFKRRQAPPILKVHTRSFGHGWHLPQVKKNLARLEWE